MREKGLNRVALAAILERRLKGDLSFRSGHILGSMCTRPHPMAIKIFKKYIEKNVGDPGLVTNTALLEKEAVRDLGLLLGASDAGGYFLTGGSEANILAIWTARKLSGKTSGEIVVGDSAHFSFDKAADLLGLRLKRVPLDSSFRMDVEALGSMISEETIAIVAVAGTTSLGVVDDIPRIAALAEAKGIYLHVDAAFGGFVLPFLDSAEKFPFDFSVRGVNSITIDPHKMGMAVIPAGGILYRSVELAKTVKFDVTYLAGGRTKQSTIVGTRSGAAVLAVWGLLNYLGRAGYRKIIERCLALTAYAVQEIRKVSGVELIAEPVINVIGIRPLALSAKDLSAILRKKGWALSLFPEHLRICIMPHVRKRHIDTFVKVLKSVL